MQVSAHPALNVPKKLMGLGIKRKVAGDFRNVANKQRQNILPPCRRFRVLFSAIRRRLVDRFGHADLHIMVNDSSKEIHKFGQNALVILPLISAQFSLNCRHVSRTT